MKTMCTLTLFFFMTGTTGYSQAPVLNDSQRSALTSAIEDEIYDYNLEKNFRDIGKQMKDDTFQVTLYVLANSDASSYYLIYPLMPYGEMYRLATVSPDGSVHLFRNPRVGFPPDSPATLTVYFDDDLICKRKQGALRLSFQVEMQPTQERLRQAIFRQRLRYGFSSLQQKLKRGRHGSKAR